MALGVPSWPVSEVAEKHPWAKYYAERGISRPSMGKLVRAAAPKPVAAVPDRKAPELSPELAAIVAAVTATQPGTTAAPFITVKQKEAVARELSRRRVRRLSRYALVAVATLLAVHVAITQFFRRVPTPEALHDYGLVLATEILPLYSNVQQPLLIDRTVILPGVRVGAEHMRYVAEVTLRLRQPLYAPANSNGTDAYRRLQESLQTAQADELKFRLFAAGSSPQAPELPLLLQMSHRAGEAFVVRVPFDATRTGWTWRIDAPQLGLRTIDTPFNGYALARYAGSPYLIFGTSESRSDIRQREKLARDYIVAVAKEVQKHSNVEAVAETPPVIPAIELPRIAEAPATEIDPDLPAAANQAAIDPDAPAIEIPELLVPPLKAAPPPSLRQRG